MLLVNAQVKPNNCVVCDSALNAPCHTRNRYESAMRNIITIFAILFLQAALAADYDQIYEGKYAWGPEVQSFTLCNTKTSYWVSFDWAGIEMQEFYKAHRKEPYQEMYLKFRGHLLDEAVDGFAEDYDGLIRVSEVKEYSFEVPKSCK